MWDWWAMISERLCWIKAIRGIRCRIVCSHAVWLCVYGLRAWYCGRCSRLPSSSSSSVCVSVTIATKSRRTGWRSLSRSHCRRSIRHLLHRHIYLACQKRKLFPFFEHTHTHTPHTNSRTLILTLKCVCVWLIHNAKWMNDKIIIGDGCACDEWDGRFNGQIICLASWPPENGSVLTFRAPLHYIYLWYDGMCILCY